MITVTVTGLAGEGKSTIAVLVAQCLEGHGIKVELSDDEIGFDRTTFERTLDNRVNGLAAKNTVKIQTKQSARSLHKP